MRRTSSPPSLSERDGGSAGYLKAVWLEIFGPVFHGFSAETDPRDPPRSPGPAPHINSREKSAPQTNSEAISRCRKNGSEQFSNTFIDVRLT